MFVLCGSDFAVLWPPRGLLLFCCHHIGLLLDATDFFGLFLSPSPSRWATVLVGVESPLNGSCNPEDGQPPKKHQYAPIESCSENS